MTEPPDSSRISFTALYTGHVWVRNGLADPRFATGAGRALFAVGAPIMAAGDLLWPGSTLEAMLLQRHKLIDHELRVAIREQGVRQVVEVAAGLSPRGLRFREEFPDDLRYVEVDLPGMAARKRAFLAQLGAADPELRVLDGDALAQSGPLSLAGLAAEHLDPELPTAVITEGLINYFDPETLALLWSRFSSLITSAGGLYLSDLVPGWLHAEGRRRSGFTSAVSKLIGLMVRGRTHLHFESEPACAEALRSAGFADAAILDPGDCPEELGLPVTRDGAVVRVLRGRI